MSAALPFLAIGLLLIILLIFLFVRSKRSDRSHSESTEDSEALADFHVEPFPQELVGRLFGTEDWNYVSLHESKRIQRLFCEERKKLAISWLRRTRDQAKALMRFHKVHAAKSTRLEPVSEVKLTFDYVLFQLSCGFLAGVIWLYGPIDAKKLVGFASGFSDRLRSLAFAILAAEQPAEGANNFRPRMTSG
jgi:hypothetical protein